MGAPAGRFLHVLAEEHTMEAVPFNRKALADWYATQHLKTDPALNRVYFLPSGAPDREIRLVEVNELVAEREELFEPIDFGIDRRADSEHTLFVLDVTPRQWGRIGRDDLSLPAGWSLDGAEIFSDNADESLSRSMVAAGPVGLFGNGCASSPRRRSLPTTPLPTDDHREARQGLFLAIRRSSAAQPCQLRSLLAFPRGRTAVRARSSRHGVRFPAISRLQALDPVHLALGLRARTIGPGACWRRPRP